MVGLWHLFEDTELNLIKNRTLRIADRLSVRCEKNNSRNLGIGSRQLVNVVNMGVIYWDEETWERIVLGGSRILFCTSPSKMPLRDLGGEGDGHSNMVCKGVWSWSCCGHNHTSDSTDEHCLDWDLRPRALRHPYTGRRKIQLRRMVSGVGGKLAECGVLRAKGGSHRGKEWSSATGHLPWALTFVS